MNNEEMLYTLVVSGEPESLLVANDLALELGCGLGLEVCSRRRIDYIYLQRRVYAGKYSYTCCYYLNDNWLHFTADKLSTISHSLHLNLIKSFTGRYTNAVGSKTGSYG